MTDEPSHDPVAAKLLADIEKFLQRTGMSARAFSESVTGSDRFVARLRAGRAPKSSTIAACNEFMKTYRKGK
jgi:hypothetical protein